MVDSTHSNVAPPAGSTAAGGASVVAAPNAAPPAVDLRFRYSSSERSSKSAKRTCSDFDGDGLFAVGSALKLGVAEANRADQRATALEAMLKKEQHEHSNSKRALRDAEVELFRVTGSPNGDVAALGAQIAQAHAVEKALRKEIATLKLAEGKNKLAELARKIELTDDKKIKIELKQEKLKEEARFEELVDEAREK